MINQIAPGPLGGLLCSFCGKSQHEVPKLIAGPKVFICSGCVLICVEILILPDPIKFQKPEDKTEGPGE